LSSSDPLADQLLALDAARPDYASRFVEQVLDAAVARGASDLHLLPTPDGLDLRWRLDGVLLPLGVFPSGAAASVVARLKVLAELLTYRTDIPQEGRLRELPHTAEMRLSTFPTLYGEKAVVRVFQTCQQLARLADLGLPNEIEARLARLLSATSGAILVTGPTGSGKTTTLYACLRELSAVSAGSRSIATLEDPIESAIPGVAQSQVQPAVGFDLHTALRSIVRQDPQVIMVGEIRDRPTAEVALQASLTGQLVLSSFHAASAAGALSRLSDMGIEPYVVRSGVLAVVSQRLVRRLCRCALSSHGEHASAQAILSRSERATDGAADGCPECGGTGYRGRGVLAEMLLVERPAVAAAILARADATELERAAVEDGMVPLRQRAAAAVASGLTSPAEIRRVLGEMGDPL
jgi:type II secretory ATPase GspE/PulE/Tfp pilus assembly ATPase PilB-like protein